jgi:hypothetical protein
MVVEFYAQLARTFAFEEVRPSMVGSALVRQEPVGVAAAIVPWNVPLFTIMLKLAHYTLLKEASLIRVRGRVTELTGLVIKASVPNVRVGEVVYIKNRTGRVKAEVVGFQGDEVMLMPLGELSGIGPDSEVIPTGKPLTI